MLLGDAIELLHPPNLTLHPPQLGGIPNYRVKYDKVLGCVMIKQ